MKFPRVLAVFLGGVVLLLSRAEGAPRVELEVAADPAAPGLARQRWLTVLKDVGLDAFRIRQADSSDRAGLEVRGSEDSPVYFVTGILTARDRLVVPGGSFGSRDTASITAWVARVRAGGAGGTEKPVAFGLTAEQLADVHERLGGRSGVDTTKVRAGEAAAAIARGLPYAVEIDPSAREALAGEFVLAENLEGLSGGTALAAALRPLGLVVVPRSTTGEVKLLVADVRAVEQSWPIGWPPEGSPRDVAPKLYEFLDVEINDTPLLDALAAIGGRLEMPLLWDHNSLARHRVDPATLRVSLPGGRTYYKRIVDRLLAPHLKAELRVDEAGQPFLWLTTVKR